MKKKENSPRLPTPCLEYMCVHVHILDRSLADWAGDMCLLEVGSDSDAAT